MLVRGPRLALRYPRPGDAARLFELGADAEVTRFFSWGPYRDVSEPLAYIDSLAEQRAAGSRLEFGIADRDDRLIGITGLSELSRRDRRAVVGTWLGRPYWGTGANAESKALVLWLAFEVLGLQRTTALASPENHRSIAALERLGFVHEGVLRSWHLHHGRPRDCAVLRMTRAEWEATELARTPVTVDGAPPQSFR